MYQLKIITSTTREGRKGILVANWITELAKQHPDFDVELLDLKEINLPLMDEPNHPSLGQYTHQHTKDWSEKISQADAFIIVLAEYNYGYPAPIKNALDYLFKEWQNKAVGFVSYGGISGGLRSTQMLKQVVTTLSMVPLTEQVTLPFFAKQIDDNGRFQANDSNERAAQNMLNKLAEWSLHLKNMRENK